MSDISILTERLSERTARAIAEFVRAEIAEALVPVDGKTSEVKLEKAIELASALSTPPKPAEHCHANPSCEREVCICPCIRCSPPQPAGGEAHCRDGWRGCCVRIRGECVCACARCINARAKPIIDHVDAELVKNKRSQVSDPIPFTKEELAKMLEDANRLLEVRRVRIEQLEGENADLRQTLANQQRAFEALGNR